jgi:hypothetical protein
VVKLIQPAAPVGTRLVGTQVREFTVASRTAYKPFACAWRRMPWKPSLPEFSFTAWAVGAWDMREDDVQIRRVTQTDASPASASHTVESLWEVIHISDVKGMIFPYDRALTLARNIAQMQAVDIYKLLDDGSEPELLESYRKITD